MMKSAKQERPSEQRFPITFQSVPAQTPHEAAKPCFAFRGLPYHVDARFEDRFFHGVWFPETIESYSSWVRRTSSASVIGGSAARRRTEDSRLQAITASQGGLRTAKAKRMTEIRLRTSKCEIGKTGKSKEEQRTENGEMLPGGQRLK